VDSFQLLETVVAMVNIPEEGILAGDVGTIIDVYTQLALAFEVQFASAIGSPRALVTLTPEQIRHLTPADVLTTRQLSTAS
jgi:hypothetical protein